MDTEGPDSPPQHDWARQRRSAEFRAQTGAYAGVGVLLALVGVGLALTKAWRAAQAGPRTPVLDGLLWADLFLVLGVVVLFAGRILEAVYLHDDRR